MSYELEKLVFGWYIEWIWTGVKVEQEGWTLDLQWRESEYPNERFTHVGSLIARKDCIKVKMTTAGFKDEPRIVSVRTTR